MRYKSSIKIVQLMILMSCANVLLKAQDKDPASYIRNNTVGYLVDDQKIAIVGSKDDLAGQSFYLVDADNTDKVVYTGKILPTRGSTDTPFKYNLPCDFSSFKTKGSYKIKLEDGTLSYPFVIGAAEEYQKAFETVLQFFRSQRCGDIDPLLHKPCHLNDAKAAIDASGGWHDAGDYIKFMITATYTTVELITAADYAMTYNLDDVLADVSPKNGVPDLLEEAHVGLDWILKMTSDYKNGNYYYQMSGEEDHDHWRLPETDDSTGVAGNPRSLHKGWGGNLLGRSAAALAVAYRVLNKSDKQYAGKCLARAEALFADRAKYENVQKSNPPDFYNEQDWRDDMVLGAAELYKTTKKKEYLNYAKDNLKKLTGDDIGWNGSDYLAYAACLRADIEPAYCKSKMKEALDARMKRSNSEVYYLSSRYEWGTTAAFTADAQKAIMYYLLTSDPSYLKLATAERDYLLGRNNWGVSFIVGLGAVYPHDAHSQVNSLAGLQKGAGVGGPGEIRSWKRVFPTLRVDNDKFAKFQSNIIYYDTEADYYTNEVALDYTAPSVFIFLYNAAEARKNK